MKRALPLSSIVSATCLFGCLVVLSGCGESVPTGTMSGKVTRNGQPVTNAIIMFTPKDAGEGASAKLGADGSYSLTSKSGSAVREGDYKISFIDESKATAAPPDPAALMNKSPEEAAKPPEKKDAGGIPKKYLNAQESGLTATVKAKTANKQDFDLKD